MMMMVRLNLGWVSGQGHKGEVLPLLWEVGVADRESQYLKTKYFRFRFFLNILFVGLRLLFMKGWINDTKTRFEHFLILPQPQKTDMCYFMFKLANLGQVSKLLFWWDALPLRRQLWHVLQKISKFNCEDNSRMTSIMAAVACSEVRSKWKFYCDRDNSTMTTDI